MKTPPPELLEQLIEKAETFLNNRFSAFKELHTKRLESFDDIITNSVSDLKNLPDTTDAAFKAWYSIEACLVELNQWIDFNDYTSFRNKLIIDWQDDLASVISGLPLFQDEVWSDLFFSSNHETSIFTSLFKRIKRLKRSLRTLSVSCINIFRTNKKSINNESHIFRARDFAVFYFQIPFLKFLDTASDKMLGTVSTSLDELHTESQHHFSELLMTDCLEEQWISGFHTGLSERAADIDERIFDPNFSQQAFDTCQNDIMALFSTWKEQVRETFLQNSNYTGTWLLPHHRYGQSSINKQKRCQQKGHNKHQKLWNTHFKSESLDWAHELALYKRQVIVVRQTTEALGIISGKIHEKIIPKCADAIEILTQTKKRIDSLQTDQDWELKKNMIRESRSLVKKFRREMIPAIASRFIGAGISQDLNRILINIQDSVDHLADTHTVFKHRGTGVPPHSEMSEIPIKDLFNEKLLVKLQSVLSNCERQLRIKLDDIVNTMSEIRQSVEFNIETSFGLLENEDYTDEAFQMVIDGIERSSGQLITLKEKVETIPAEIANDLGKIAFDWTMNIQGLLDSEKLIALKLTLTRARASSRLKTLGTDFQKKLQKRRASFTTSFKKNRGRCLESFTKIKSYLGVTLPEDDVQIQFTQFLLDTRHKLESLPFVYQQLFQIEPLTDARLFFGREDELRMLKDDIDAWEKNSNSVLTVVVGEKGSGKTTLLNLLELSIPNKYTISVCPFSETVRSTEEIIAVFTQLFPEKPFATVDELESYLMKLKSPTILIVENIHNLFIKNMEGFDRLEYFLGLMYRTRNKVLWVCSCAQYSWEYLDKSLGISRAFNRVVMLKSFTGKQIESMILTRHRITGYQLKFGTSTKISRTRKFRKTVNNEERQSMLKRNFFEQIQKIASGNISVAILFWLRSIESIQDHELRLAAQIEFNVKFLSAVNTHDLFTLGALAQHETLSVDDHALIFRQDPRKSFLTMNALERMGILQLSGTYYRIHPFLYRHVIRSLKLQNILH